jgi:hypothetical protein
VMFSSDVSRVMKLRRMGWPCGIMREKWTEVGKLTGKRPLWRSRGRWEDHMKIESSLIATLHAVIQIKLQ